MKTLVLYDSVYGNTEKIASAIGNELNGTVVPVRNVTSEDLKKYDFVIVGSPVHGGHPTPNIHTLLHTLPNNWLSSVKVAAFDTRFALEDHGLGIKILMKVLRYAADRIAKELKVKGGTLVIKPEGFIVNNKEGPLKEGEIHRARNWAKEVKKYV